MSVRVVYEPIVPHRCDLPGPRRAGTIVECNECGMRWVSEVSDGPGWSKSKWVATPLKSPGMVKEEWVDITDRVRPHITASPWAMSAAVTVAEAVSCPDFWVDRLARKIDAAWKKEGLT